ncbi:MAG: DNA repair protein RadA [Clostridia bacterium]|nr:DNA repair protein RadA [Clostridia bacterium]
MAKSKSVFICGNCGYEALKWAGRCPSCGEFNTMTERMPVAQTKAAAPVSCIQEAVQLGSIETNDEERYHTGLRELDRVLGGGIVKGSLILLSGDPGIGKSTIMLQICQHLGRDHRVLYVSGEESARQIKLRADRLKVTTENLMVMAQTDIEIIVEHIRQLMPDIVIIDSIQTMSHSAISSLPASVSQVRECTNYLMRAAKQLEIPIFVIGHVNKDGAIAGPKVLEHIVDSVLFFEGERNLSYRILRAVKNRYGSTNEIGIFEMRDVGLIEVENPSMMLLSGRPTGVSGTCIACVMEGSRPILAEIQGLVTPTGFGNPRRMSTGFDYNRMSLLLAVLEKRAGFFFSNQDTYLNVIGGLKLDEPAADLAVAMALVSGLRDKPIDDSTVVFGEIGLGGEIRSVMKSYERACEAARLGFKRCILPVQSLDSFPGKIEGIELIGVRNIRQAVSFV